MRKEYKFNFRGFDYYCLVAKSNDKKCHPIVAISGAFQNMQSWNKYLDFYTQFSTVILVDVPGSGKSDLLPHHYSLDFLADSLFYWATLSSIFSSLATIFSVRNSSREG